MLSSDVHRVACLLAFAALVPAGVAQDRPADPARMLLVTPSAMTLLVGETQPVVAIDESGKPVKDVTWTIGATGVARVSAGQAPVVTAVAPGRTAIAALYRGQSAQATVTVLAGDTMPPGTRRFVVEALPGYRTEKITPAQPTIDGPDIYVIETNAKGENMVRTFTASGTQLWMSPLGLGDAPPKSAPPASAPPRASSRYPAILQECRRVQVGMAKEEVEKIFKPKVQINAAMYTAEGLRLEGKDIACWLIFDATSGAVRQRKIILRDPD